MCERSIKKLEAFKKLTSQVAVLNRANVDTDQIIPKQFLKRIDKSGFGKFAFFDWRYLDDGSLNDQFELNHPLYKEAKILLAGPNFGCGSSREHAPWALQDYGFEVIIAPSFADIFYQNSLKNGLLPIVIEERIFHSILSKAAEKEYELTVDLKGKKLLDQERNEYHFSIDLYWQEMLLEGKDEIDVTLKYKEEINKYEIKQGFVD
ncbi:3-isopropylmalate dehydratase small subunit [Bacillus carboniphilus]|uniref:3-isopropylmalate dehydratase small subunit n=1 Tax=Bacillus carboniphilus TaxID=86663 RepID=A0ABY9JXK8_9BACI|nr:3-isopropylmalate dehydratase small subunit [Bacillus carboniphilus]WLR44112.1 3-isopropylmalate dehydratase small subunit [Bacillus carboniphilus]